MAADLTPEEEERLRIVNHILDGEVGEWKTCPYCMGGFARRQSTLSYGLCQNCGGTGRYFHLYEKNKAPELRG